MGDDVGADAPRLDFFISYNHKDQQWAEWIAWRLEEAGFTTRIQAWDFAVGSNFVREMDKAAKRAERTVAVLSPNFLASSFTFTEWAAQFAKDPMGDHRLLIPVCVEKCDLDGLLAQIVYVDFVDTAENDCKNRLLAAVAAGRAKPNKPPAFPHSSSVPNASPPKFPGTSELCFTLESGDESLVVRNQDDVQREVEPPWYQTRFRVAYLDFNKLTREAVKSDAERQELFRHATTLGEMLFDTLFDDAGRQQLDDALKPGADHRPLLTIQSADDWLLSLPWELLCRDDQGTECCETIFITTAFRNGGTGKAGR